MEWKGRGRNGSEGDVREEKTGREGNGSGLKGRKITGR